MIGPMFAYYKILEVPEEYAVRRSSQYQPLYRRPFLLVTMELSTVISGLEMARMGRYLVNQMTVGSKERR